MRTIKRWVLSTNKEEKIPIKLTLSYFHDDTGSGLEYTVDPLSQNALQIYGERLINSLNLDHNHPISYGSSFRLYVPNMSREELLGEAEKAADNFRVIYGYPGGRPEDFDLTIIKK